MARERYLIVGLAKTGTTAVAMTVRNTLRIQGFCMEPRDLATIEAETDDRLVIKILFDHWLDRTEQLRKFFYDNGDDRPSATIVIVRDPRDEAISRLHYLAYNYFSTRPTTEDDRAAWLEIFCQKEAAPETVGLIDMENRLKSRFGSGFLVGRQVYESFLQFIDDLIRANAETTCLLRYEDFVANTIPAGSLQRLLSGSRNVGPWFHRVHRSGSSGEWQYFLTDHDLSVINGLCEPVLKRFGYSMERKPTGQKPSHTTGSSYVDKLISEGRSSYLESQLSQVFQQTSR
jgi:hypothetical protein